MSDTPTTPYPEPVIDEAQELDIGAVDVVLAILTLPLFLFALQYAVTGAERLVATRRARLKLFGWLLLIEVIGVVSIVLVVVR